jgi:hypothetical protein
VLHRIALVVVSKWCQKQMDGISSIPLQVEISNSVASG